MRPQLLSVRGLASAASSASVASAPSSPPPEPSSVSFAATFVFGVLAGVLALLTAQWLGQLVGKAYYAMRYPYYEHIHDFPDLLDVEAQFHDHDDDDEEEEEGEDVEQHHGSKATAGKLAAVAAAARANSLRKASGNSADNAADDSASSVPQVAKAAEPDSLCPSPSATCFPFDHPSRHGRNASTASLRSASHSEPPAARHTRVAVRALLHFTELSPEVLPQAHLFANHGLRLARASTGGSAASRRLSILQRHATAPPNVENRRSLGKTRTSAGKKTGKRVSLGRKSGAKAAAAMYGKRIRMEDLDSATLTDTEDGSGPGAADILSTTPSSRPRVRAQHFQEIASAEGEVAEKREPPKKPEEPPPTPASRRRLLSSPESPPSLPTNGLHIRTDQSAVVKPREYKPRRLIRSMMDVSGSLAASDVKLEDNTTSQPPLPAAAAPPLNRFPRRKLSSITASPSRSASKYSLADTPTTPVTPPTPPTPTPIKSNIPNYYFSAEHSHEWMIPGYGRVRFTDHAPVAFKAVRALFNYSFSELDKALAKHFSVEMSAGKSDSIFFTTHNARFLLKTLRGSELDNLKQFLPAYVGHIIQWPDTLLPRYLGLYSFERISGAGAEASGANGGASPTVAASGATLAAVDDALGTRFSVVLMAHAFDTQLDICAKYDFKGSNVGRQTLPTSRHPSRHPSGGSETSPTSATTATIPGVTSEPQSQLLGTDVTLKELDFQRLLQVGGARKIAVGPEQKARLMEQLRVDVDLLRRWEFMDYSVLIGVHRVARERVTPTTVTADKLRRPQPATVQRPASPVPVISRGYSTDCVSPSVSSNSMKHSMSPNRRSPIRGGSTSDRRQVVSDPALVPAPSSVPTTTLPLLRTVYGMLEGIIGTGAAAHTPPAAAAFVPPPLPPKRNSNTIDMHDVPDILEAESDDNEDDRGSDEAVESENDATGHHGTTITAVRTAVEEDLGHIPFHKQHLGGLRGVDLPVEDDADASHEIYYIGLIDILQKYNMIKWLEKNIIRRPLFNSAAVRGFTDMPPPAPAQGGGNGGARTLAGLFMDTTTGTESGQCATPAAVMQRSDAYPTPKGSPPGVDGRRGDNGLTAASPSPSPAGGAWNSRFEWVLPGMSTSENSVEEPGRYAERFLGFVDGVVV
ncbi:Phosphatidylinositol 5-phosphate 4-kinase type-2 alpha [Geranomyces variabilis]|nr:Phosphatidylinositol 5-phosphate 4-kinase type-2 alpha [Geranomyces variabilis]